MLESDVQANFVVEGLYSESSNPSSSCTRNPSLSITDSKDSIIHVHHSSKGSTTEIRNEKNVIVTSVDDYSSNESPRHFKLPKLLPNSYDWEDLIGKASNKIHEWTPFLLVTTYFVSSIFAYLLFPAKLTEIFWFIYNFTNFVVAFSTALEAFMSIATVRLSRKLVEKAAEKDCKFPTPDEDLLILDIVIVAYLPNEKDIIMDRIHHAVENIVYPTGKIRVNVVYNTPEPIQELEDQMWEAADKYSQLRIIKVENSTSKADNLNYFLSLDTGSDVTAIFDCDHYPHPHNPRWAVERFIKGGIRDEKPEVDIVQGRCIVFNSTASFLAGLISVEFDKIYAVSHPGRAAIWGFGLFCGSNGYWRTPLLRELKMDGDMLTEDIDSALRACSRGLIAVHDLNVVSYELAPVTWQAFWKQRLRWAQGWAQVTLKHSVLSFNRAKEGERVFATRFGLLNLLLIRELSYYLVTQFACLVCAVICLNFPLTPAALWKTVFFRYPVSEWMFFFSLFCLFCTLYITNGVKSEFASRWMVVKFCVLYPFYLLLLATIGVYGHARQIAKYSSWNPTARE